jgi:hypothetical protein
MALLLMSIVRVSVVLIYCVYDALMLVHSDEVNYSIKWFNAGIKKLPGAFFLFVFLGLLTDNNSTERALGAPSTITHLTSRPSTIDTFSTRVAGQSKVHSITQSDCQIVSTSAHVLH